MKGSKKLLVAAMLLSWHLLPVEAAKITTLQMIWQGMLQPETIRELSQAPRKIMLQAPRMVQ